MTLVEYLSEYINQVLKNGDRITPEVLQEAIESYDE